MTNPKFNIISEILEKNSLSYDEFADMLGISPNYLYRLETGTRKPSLDLLEKLAKFGDVSIGTVVDSLYDSTGHESVRLLDGIRMHLDSLNKMQKERKERLEQVQRNAELEHTVEHLRMLLKLHMAFEAILLKEHLTKKEKKMEIEELAKLAACSDEFSFDEILATFRVSRPLLKSWLEAEKKIFKCKRMPDMEVKAATPSEAALRLRCFDCDHCASAKCDGYGDMKSPDNIISLIAQLEEKGITRRDEQAHVLKESYGMSNMTAHQISEILYRNKTGKKIPEGAYFLEASEGSRD